MPSEHPNNERRRACAIGSRSHSRIKRAVGSEPTGSARRVPRGRATTRCRPARVGMLRAGAQRVGRCTQRHDAAAPAREPLGLPHPHVARPTVGGPHEDVALDCVLARLPIRVRRARLRRHLEQPQAMFIEAATIGRHRHAARRADRRHRARRAPARAASPAIAPRSNLDNFRISNYENCRRSAANRPRQANIPMTVR